MFYNCSALRSLPDISKWITKDIPINTEMFEGCNSLESLPDISKWNNYNLNESFLISKESLAKKDYLSNFILVTDENNIIEKKSLSLSQSFIKEATNYIYLIFHQIQRK